MGIEVIKRKEQILALVNSNVYKELITFYSLNSFFNILNISRKETIHSDFIAWLLRPNSNHDLGVYCLRKLLETIIIPINKSQNKNSKDKFPEDLEDIVISGNYEIINAKVEREKNTGVGFIDIYIEMELLLQKNLDNKRKLRVIVENKVKSKEGDMQTQRYYNWAMKKDIEEEFQSIFIYLTPLTNIELKKLLEPQCECKNFIQINYQYLVDFVIEPVRKMKIPDEAQVFIDNYLRTLSYPSLQIDISENERGDITMAIGERERDLLRNFWEANKELLIATLSSLRDDPEISDEDRVNLDKGLEVAIKAGTKDSTKYRFRDNVYAKNRLVHAVIKKYTEDNPDIKYEELKILFPDDMQGTKYCVFVKRKEAEMVSANTGTPRHFIKDNEVVFTSDEVVAVCSQWGINRLDVYNSNINKFIRKARELGYSIEEL